jgi:hypothetical protein
LNLIEESNITKAPCAENLIQLMEWLKLGKKFHIHKEFLKYLKISELIPLCLVSKHYYNKYLNYCYNYFMVSSSPMLHIIKNNEWLNYYYPVKNPKDPLCINKDLVLKYKLSTKKKTALIISHSDFLKNISILYFPKNMISYNEYCEMKKLYTINKKNNKTR